MNYLTLVPLYAPPLVQVVLFHEGLTSLIAHIRVGNMQVALEAKSTVLPTISTVTLFSWSLIECLCVCL